MKTDLYAKIVHTIIAICLLWSNFAASRMTVKAESPQKVVISDVDTMVSSLPIHLTEPIEFQCK